ncbi:MAG TPA: asparaginase, partial [Gemmatimonadales bacterium]
MSEFRVEVTRGGLVESIHRVSVAVADADGHLLASAGDPGLITYWRSAAKPFQAIPLVEDGVLERFGLGSEELALACASHSSEVVHLAVAERFLARIGCAEDDLACGPHPPLGSAVAREVADRRTPLTPRWSNCSGKHAGMLALARAHGWPTGGYEQAGGGGADFRFSDAPLLVVGVAVGLILAHESLDRLPHAGAATSLE